MDTRTVYHPIQKDIATYVETATESGGVQTILDVELEPGGGTTPHFHRAFTETFEAIDGQIEVYTGKVGRRLAAGEQLVAPPQTLHHFHNIGSTRARLRVILTPGSPGFEQALAIAYGLAQDGRVWKHNSLPKNLLEAAVLLDLSDTHPAGAAAAILPVFRLLARLAKARGVDRRLLEKYPVPGN